MKRKPVCLLMLLLFGSISGCTKVPAERTLLPSGFTAAAVLQRQEGTAQTHSGEILGKIWDNHTAGEQFLVFGGVPEKAVPGAPGDLETEDKAMLEARYFLTPELCACIAEGAAMEHLLNRHVFCSAVFRLAEAVDTEDYARKLCESLEEASWQDRAPQRFLIAIPEEGFVLVAFGQEKTMDTFLIRMSQTFPQGECLYYQEIAQKRGR